MSERVYGYRFEGGRLVPMREPCPNPRCVGPGCAVCKQVYVRVCGAGDLPTFQITEPRS